MKPLLIPLLVLCILLTFTLITNAYIENLCGELSLLTGQSITAAGNGQWQIVRDKVYEIEKTFSERQQYIAAFIRHSEIDEVLLTMSRAKAAASTEDLSLFSAEASALYALLEHMSTLDKLSAGNLF